MGLAAGTEVPPHVDGILGKPPRMEELSALLQKFASAAKSGTQRR